MRKIISAAGEVLDCEREPSLKAIADGASRLSHGLILEGLMVRFFIRRALAVRLDRLPTMDFIRAWSAAADLFPGLHPDGYEDVESGWPPVLRRFAAEAWRRAEVGGLADYEHYPSDAQWSVPHDRLTDPTPDETGRRREIAALCESVEV